MTLKEAIVRFIKDDRGQTTTEYILILAVVVLIATKFKKEIGARLDSLIGNVGNRMDEAVSNDF